MIPSETEPVGDAILLWRCRQHAAEHDRLRAGTALDAKSPADAQARAALRRLQGAEAHLAWLHSVQNVL